MSALTDIKFRNPLSAIERGSRDSLLTQSLREGPLNWSYDSEYPLVLSPEGNSTSWCAFLDDQLIGHANLWPRTLQHTSNHKSLEIGLIGNVATHEKFRGQGHMRSLIHQLAQIAEKQGLHALVLWSDLSQFYQNLGFRSIGREWRLTFSRTDLKVGTGIVKMEVNSLTEAELSSMLASRPMLEWGINRTTDEFRALLGIPETLLFVRRQGAKIISWVVIGKGTDMQAIIHEWGASSPNELLANIQTIICDYNARSLTLLVPGSLNQQWVTLLKHRATDIEEHPMAMGMPLGSKGELAMNALAKSFIWGLDSI